LGAVFIIAVVVAIFTDVAGMLQYFNLVSGLPSTTLEIGAAMTAATVVPLLLMGMSISTDGNK
jgi:nitric oxide reductase large subunit